MQTFDLTIRTQAGAPVAHFPPAGQSYGQFSVGDFWDVGGTHHQIVQVRHAIVPGPGGAFLCQVLLVVQ